MEATQIDALSDRLSKALAECQHIEGELIAAGSESKGSYKAITTLRKAIEQLASAVGYIDDMADIADNYASKLIDQVIAVGPEYEGHIYSVTELLGIDKNDEPNADQWHQVKDAIETANSDISPACTLELCEYASRKWDIRLRHVYDNEGNAIEAN